MGVFLAAVIAGAVLVSGDAAASGHDAGAGGGVPTQIEPWPETEARIAILYHRRRILAPVHVEGVGERLFIIDTAAGTSLISSSLRDQLALGADDVRRQRIRGATGVIELDYVRLPGLEFGEVRHDDIWSVVADLNEFQPVHGVEVAGVLGVDVLSRTDVRLDLAAGEIVLLDRRARTGPQAEANDGVPFHSRAQAGFVQFTARIDGAPVAAVLDTGAREGVLNWAAAGLAGLDPQSAAIVRTGGVSSGLDGAGVAHAKARLDGLCLGSACFDRAPVRIADLAVFGLVGAQGGDGPSMLVGADMLERCVAEILYSRGVLRLCEG